MLFKRIYQFLIPSLYVVMGYLLPSPTITNVQGLSARSIVFCPFFEVTGWQCPGCGMTRGLMAFFARDLELSLYFNPIAPALGFAFVALWLMSFLKRDFKISDVTYYFTKIPRSFWRSGVLVLLAWGVLRNSLDLL